MNKIYESFMKDRYTVDLKQLGCKEKEEYKLLVSTRWIQHAVLFLLVNGLFATAWYFLVDAHLDAGVALSDLGKIMGISGTAVGHILANILHWYFARKAVEKKHVEKLIAEHSQATGQVINIPPITQIQLLVFGILLLPFIAFAIGTLVIRLKLDKQEEINKTDKEQQDTDLKQDSDLPDVYLSSIWLQEQEEQEKTTD